MAGALARTPCDSPWHSGSADALRVSIPAPLAPMVHSASSSPASTSGHLHSLSPLPGTPSLRALPGRAHSFTPLIFAQKSLPFGEAWPAHPTARAQPSLVLHPPGCTLALMHVTHSHAAELPNPSGSFGTDGDLSCLDSGGSPTVAHRGRSLGRPSRLTPQGAVSLRVALTRPETQPRGPGWEEVRAVQCSGTKPSLCRKEALASTPCLPSRPPGLSHIVSAAPNSAALFQPSRCREGAAGTRKRADYVCSWLMFQL